MKTTIFLATVIISALLFVSATVWEGVTDVAAAKDKPGNFSIATNAFPRNTVVDITNLENGKKVRVRVVSVLETNGLLATLSRNAAESIDLRSNATCRIRMTQPADDIAFAHYKLGPINPLDAAVVASVAPELVKDEKSVNNEKATAAVKELPADETPVAVAVVEPAPAETPAETVSDDATADIYTAIVTGDSVSSGDSAGDDASAISDGSTNDDAIATVTDDTATAGDAGTAGDAFTETTTITTVTETTTTTTTTETAVAHNDADYDYVAPIAAIAAVGAEPAPTEEIAPPAAIEVVAQPAPQPVEQAVASQSRTTATRSTVTQSTAAPVPVKILPSEERLPAADQVAIDPRYLAPPIKQETARPAVVTAPSPAPTPAPLVTPAPTYTATPTQFSPFQVPLISRLEPNKWYVQVGVYTRPDYVEDEINRIGSGYPLAVQNVGTDTNPLFRVLLGPLNQGESSAMLKRFQSIGYTDAFVRYN